MNVRSPAAAFAWEFGRRHRWGLIAIAVYVAALAAIGHGDEESFPFTVLVPSAAIFIYFLAVFTFGLEGDLAARESIYPRRFFTLPLSSAALAALPMIYGCAAIAVLWVSTRAFAAWSVPRVPIVWPALLAASLLAWTQALTWTPYPLRGLRVVVTVLWLASIDAIVMTALHFNAGEPLMLAMLAPNIPLAYLVARAAVRRARCGDVPEWQLGVRFAVRPRMRPFASAMRAQAWLEWRQHGRSLPLLVALLLPFELAMLFAFRETRSIVIEVCIIILSTPVLMATFVGASAGGTAAFTLVRPMMDRSLVAAKLIATLRSASVTWLLVTVSTAAALELSGTAPVIVDGVHWVVQVIGPPRAAVAIVLAAAFLFASTWKQLVHSVAVELSGRAWLSKASVFATLLLLAIALPVLHWMSRSRPAMAALWNAIPWVAGAVVCVRTLLALWVVTRLFEKRVISARALVIAAACWSGAVFVIFAALAAILPELVVRHYFLFFVAILQVPLVRLAAAPLALAWNRHR